MTDLGSDLVREAASLTLIRRWLDECSDNHEACRLPDTGSGFAPTRLLDLVGEGVSAKEQQCMRLVCLDMAEPGANEVRYAALSYCWGNDPRSLLSAATSRTTKDDLATRYTHGVPEEILPQSIRDAILVARQLGRYPVPMGGSAVYCPG